MKGGEGFALQGRSIMAGFRAAGYRAFGTGAAQWFDPETPTGLNLTGDFEDFFYPGNTWSLGRQLSWLGERVAAARRPVFAFLNIGETHVPYYFEGAPWDRADNPCQPYNPRNRAMCAASGSAFAWSMSMPVSGRCSPPFPPRRW